jgi:hypothetical protein
MRLVSRAWEAAVLPLNYTRPIRGPVGRAGTPGVGSIPPPPGLEPVANLFSEGRPSEETSSRPEPSVVEHVLDGESTATGAVQERTELRNGHHVGAAFEAGPRENREGE